MRDQFEISLAVFCLSIAWSDNTRRSQTRSSREKEVYPICDHSYRYTIVCAREKAALLISLVQLVFTPFASMIVCLVFQVADLHYIGAGFSLINSSHPVFYFFIAQIFLTLFGYHATWLASTMYTERGAFTLPIVLATPLALVFIESESLCNTSFIPLACGPQKGPDLYCLIATCILLLVGQFLSTECFTLIRKNRQKSHVFWLQYYTGEIVS